VTVETQNSSKRSTVKVKQSHTRIKNAALRAYSRQKAQPISDELIVELLPMVPKIVHRVVAYLKPPLSFDDLVSAGTIGLIKAAKNFDPSRHVEFKTYAYIRIKGAVLDELRTWCLVPPNLSRNIQNAERISRKITQQTGVAPTDEQLADELGTTVEKLNPMLQNARARHFLSIDTAPHDDPALRTFIQAAATAAPDEQMQKNEMTEKLAQAIEQLPQKQRQVIILYYHQELNMKQVAEVLQITESRVSQLHAGAVFNLSAKLTGCTDGK